MLHARIILTYKYTKQEKLSAMFPIPGSVFEIEEVLEMTGIVSLGALKVQAVRLRYLMDLRIKKGKIIRIA